MKKKNLYKNNKKIINFLIKFKKKYKKIILNNKYNIKLF